MPQLILYSRPDCHLCELAAELIGACLPGQTVSKMDIEDDLKLISRYGIRVPVLQRTDTGRELDWPFDKAMLARFISG